MKPSFLYVFLFILIASGYSLKVSAQLELSTDKEIPYYEAGEWMQFQVESESDEDITYWITYGKFADTIATGIVSNHNPGSISSINFKLDEPGFVFCHIEQDFNEKVIAAAFSPNDIKVVDQRPDDFNQFWDDQIAAMSNLELDPDLSFLEEDTYTKTYSISLKHLDGRRIYGFISFPKTSGPYPASITLPPFGSSANVAQPDNFTSERAGMIAISLSIHNAEPESEDPNAYQPDDPTDRERIYYRYAVLGAIRIIDYLHTLDDFDKENICLIGGSQGGGLSLLVAGIDNRVNLIIQSIAALSGHGQFQYGKAAGFPYYLNNSFVTNGSQSHLNKTAVATSYYDAVFSASTAQVNSLNYISYQDQTCPPATGYAAFNNLPGPKIMGHSIFAGHSSPSSFINDRYQFFRRHYEAAHQPPFPYADSNEGYFVDAGVNSEIATLEPLQLSAWAERDGNFGNDWNVEWDLIEGPGTVIFNDNNILNPTATFSKEGDYKLRLIITDPYQEDEELFFQLVDYVSVTVTENLSNLQNEFGDNFLSIFPNPTSDRIHVQFKLDEVRDLKLTIIRSDGAVIYRDKVKTDEMDQSISLIGFAKGHYILEIEDGKNGFKKPFVIQ